jgi:hypothetical protein
MIVKAPTATGDTDADQRRAATAGTGGRRGGRAINAKALVVGYEPEWG